MSYWIIEYDLDGLPICEICGKSFKKLCSHVVQKHNISSREYKIQNWLDIWKWICCQSTRQSLQEHIKKNYDLVVTQNLISKWEQTRFKDWSTRRRYFSTESLIRRRNRNKDNV
jgi:hypothetical protein